MFGAGNLRFDLIGRLRARWINVINSPLSSYTVIFYTGATMWVSSQIGYHPLMNHHFTCKVAKLLEVYL